MALTVLVGFSSAFATSEGIKASQSKSRREEHRSRKNNLIVHCTKSCESSPLLEGRRVVLSGDKSTSVDPSSGGVICRRYVLTNASTSQLYVDTGTDPEGTFGHPFAGYYLAYPETKYSGLVSTITDKAPIMNWIYVDRGTYEVKFGPRLSSEANITGPFDCTRQDRRLTLAGWEGFVAVKEGDFWALYFDFDDDRLRAKGKDGARVLEVELFRKELKVRKPTEVARTGSETTEQTTADSSTDSSSSQSSEKARSEHAESDSKGSEEEHRELDTPDVD